MPVKRKTRELKGVYRIAKSASNGKASAKIPAPRVKYPPAKILGKYIVADPRICHGKPTYRGTRIMVWQVLEMLSEGMSWETVSEQWRGRVSQEAIVESLGLGAKLLKRVYRHRPRSFAL